MLRVSDYVANFLAEKGIHDVFMISGGGAIHLNDSIGKHPKIRYICNLHEQACAFAMEGYARLKNDIGVCIVTTGPGATNAITGAFSAWIDSTPSIVISGQVKRSTIKPSTLRQLGDQEIDIVSMVKPITKYAVTIMDPNEIRYHLEKAYYLAKNGRPGTVWLDIPFDVQASLVEPDKLKSFDPSECEIKFDMVKLKQQVEETFQSLKNAERPVMLVGKGIRLSHAEKQFRELVDLLNIPVIFSLTGYDLLEDSHQCNYGRQGTIGQRRGNFIVQNSDVLLCIGTRLNIRMVSFNYENFAREAKRIVVDIDFEELKKPTIKIDLPICSDAKLFIELLLERLRKEQIEHPSTEQSPIGEKGEWIKYADKIYEQYPPAIGPQSKRYLDIYLFFREISKLFSGGEIIVQSNGFVSIAPHQTLEIKKGQRVLVNSGSAAMGFGLPAAIGACVANNRKAVYCFEGDGSLQMNIQELQTLKHYTLPVKLFVLNNSGYVSIRETQKMLFNGKFIASSDESGVSSPNLKKIAKAYGLDYFRIRNSDEMAKLMPQILQHHGPLLCELISNPNIGYAVKASSYTTKSGKLVTRPLEDMFPFLPREEFRKNMIIKTINDEE